MKGALIAAVALAALVALPAASWAQVKPDLSGTWTMDEAKSDPAPARAGGAGGGGGGGGRAGSGAAASMTIKQTQAQLTIARSCRQPGAGRRNGAREVTAGGKRAQAGFGCCWIEPEP